MLLSLNNQIMQLWFVVCVVSVLDLSYLAYYATLLSSVK